MTIGQVVRLDNGINAEVKAVTVHGGHQTLLVAVELPSGATPKSVR